MRITIWFFFLLLFSALCVPSTKAQDTSSKPKNRLNELDSLSSLNQSNDSLLYETIELAKKVRDYDVAVKHTANLINLFKYENAARAKYLIPNTIPLLKSVEDKEVISKFYFELADLYYYSGEFEESISNFDSAFYYAKDKNTPLKGLSKLGKGIVYVDKGEFGNASLTLQEAIGYFQKDKDTLNWINAKNSMTILYGKNGFFDEETKERNELISLAEAYKKYPSLPSIFYNAAASANKMGEQDKRIAYLKQALSSNETSEYQGFFKPILTFGLIGAYAENDSLAKANKLMTELEREPDQISGFNEAFYLDAKKRLAFAEKEYQKALDYGTAYLNLKQESKEYEEIQEADYFLSKVYKLLGDENQALKHFESYSHLKDSITNIQKARVLTYYQTLYETEKRDLKIAAQQSNINLLQAQKKLQRQWLIFGGLGLVFAFAFYNVLRSRRFAKKAQKQNEEFSQYVISSQEQERNRVAMELHDSVGQQLMLLTRKAKSSGDVFIQDLATDTLANIRAISHNLYPVVLKRLGFTKAAQELVNDLDSTTELFFTTEIAFVDDVLNEEKALHLYRILQETLQNIVKHAKASTVAVTVLKEQSRVSLTVQDNGMGFDYKEVADSGKSLGLKSIQERCKIIKAHLEVHSETTKGTRLKISITL
ncbi:MAG: ATP-binding protein [Bacteroidota bacterium]